MKDSKDEQIKAVFCTVNSISKEQLTRTTMGEENLFEEREGCVKNWGCLTSSISTRLL